MKAEKNERIEDGDVPIVPLKVVRDEPAKKVSVFGSAKVKPAATSPKSDKITVHIDGLESKLLKLQTLKGEIADLEAQLNGITDEIKGIGKEEFIKLYIANKTNPNTFLIQDGNGCVMVLPTDKYISVKDEERANQLRREYGNDVITADEKYYFNKEVLERNQDAIEELIANSTTISDSDKENLLTKVVTYSIKKGIIDELYHYGNKMENALADIQPIFMLKSCGGKMASGGDFDIGELIIDVPVLMGYSSCHYAPIYGEAEVCPTCGEHCNVLSEDEVRNELAEMSNEDVGNGADVEGSEENEQRWEARGYARGGAVTTEKEFEISHDDNVYWGAYHYEGNKLFMDTCQTMNDVGEIVDVEDNNMRLKVYSLLDDKTIDDRIGNYDEFAKGGDLGYRQQIAPESNLNVSSANERWYDEQTVSSGIDTEGSVYEPNVNNSNVDETLHSGTECVGWMEGPHVAGFNDSDHGIPLTINLEQFEAGGKVNATHKRLDELWLRNQKSVDMAMQDYAGELGIFDLYFGHKVDKNKKAEWHAGYKYLHDSKDSLVIYVTPRSKAFEPHVWIEGGKFTDPAAAEFQAKQIRKMRDTYKKVEVIKISDERAKDAIPKLEVGGIPAGFEGRDLVRTLVMADETGTVDADSIISVLKNGGEVEGLKIIGWHLGSRGDNTGNIDIELNGQKYVIAMTSEVGAYGIAKEGAEFYTMFNQKNKASKEAKKLYDKIEPHVHIWISKNPPELTDVKGIKDKLLAMLPNDRDVLIEIARQQQMLGKDETEGNSISDDMLKLWVDELSTEETKDVARQHNITHRHAEGGAVGNSKRSIFGFAKVRDMVKAKLLPFFDSAAKYAIAADKYTVIEAKIIVPGGIYGMADKRVSNEVRKEIVKSAKEIAKAEGLVNDGYIIT